jgi:hypothetical protein
MEWVNYLFGDPNPIKNYKLVRESDGLTKHGQTAGWIEWKKKDKTFKKLHDKPAVGRSFILDPNRMSFTWCTSTVTEVLEGRFKARKLFLNLEHNNSVYELWKLNAND